MRWSAQTLTVCSFAGLRPCPARLTTVQVSIRQRARSGWTVDTHTHSHTHAYGNLQLRGHCTLTRQNRTDRAQLHAYTYSLFVRPSLARDRLALARSLCLWPVAVCAGRCGGSGAAWLEDWRSRRPAVKTDSSQSVLPNSPATGPHTLQDTTYTSGFDQPRIQ